MPNINAILAQPYNSATSSRGAAMGRRNQPYGIPEKLHLQHVTFVDGDYDRGGAYWGGGRGILPLWCAFSPENTTNTIPIRVFVRAANRATAKTEVLDVLNEEGFTFYR